MDLLQQRAVFLWCMLLPVTMMLSMTHAVAESRVDVTKDHGNVSSLCCYLNPVKGCGSWYDWKPCGCLWICVPVRGYVGFHGTCYPGRLCGCSWSVLSPENVGICGLCYRQRPYWCVWPGLQLEAMLMSVVHCHQGSCLCPWPCCSRGPWCCSWPKLLPKAMGIHVVCAATWSYIDSCVPCCSQKPCGNTWSGLPLIIMGKEESFVVESMTVDSQARRRNIEGFCDNLSLPPSPKSV